MRQVEISNTHPEFLDEFVPERPMLLTEDYRQRLDLLLDRMARHRLSHCVVYADREHFANMDYLIGFEPRFEEALLIVQNTEKCTLLVGNECMSYSAVSPIPMERILYQNFSLQGQPRDKIKPLKDIFSSLGIDGSTFVGLVGYKYFDREHALGEANEAFDVPAYILQHLQQASQNHVVNFTRQLTGLPEGIRMTIRSAREVACAEYMACKATRVVQRILKNLKPGISELELSGKVGLDFSPISVFPMLNFGSEHIQIGLRSPDNRRLAEGDPCGLCCGLRGSLISRVGIAAKNEQTMRQEYLGAAENYFKPFWKAISVWYEALHLGVNAGHVFSQVMSVIGEERFGVQLNPGHYIGGDEWVNSPFKADSPINLEYPAHLQCDIIVSSSTPVMTGICEDSIILSDSALRKDVAAQFPAVWERIKRRQDLMRTVLGIQLHEDVLPLGPMNGVYHPYMLDLNRIFVNRQE